MSPAKRVCGLTRLQTTHVVGLEGVAVEMDREAFRRAADHHGLHAGADRAADERLGDAVRLEDFLLPFGRGAAVAAHGRDDKRLGSQGP